MLEIDIFRNSSQRFLGVLKGVFWWFGCPDDTQMCRAINDCQYTKTTWHILWYMIHHLIHSSAKDGLTSVTFL